MNFIDQSTTSLNVDTSEAKKWIRLKSKMCGFKLYLYRHPLQLQQKQSGSRRFRLHKTDSDSDTHHWSK